ncbi:MAG: GNAT family N-acetyltransferase [Gallionellaceae bacterium]|jgi:ribosomal protein S18 acetylase RimI-like enzyme
MRNMHLRPLAINDMPVIYNWPAYPAEFGKLDYALRSEGWLAEFYGKPDSWVYAAEYADELIAYSLLAMTDPKAAEFRIALHPQKLHQGLGKIITQMTLHEGFTVLNLTCIHLIVRTNNATAIRLYQSFGFQMSGKCTQIINRETVEFIKMELMQNRFTQYREITS